MNVYRNSCVINLSFAYQTKKRPTNVRIGAIIEICFTLEEIDSNSGLNENA